MYQFKIGIALTQEFEAEQDLYSLTFNLVDEQGESTIKLVRAVIENTSELNWFSENEIHIRNDELPSCVEKRTSIAPALENFYDGLEVDDSEECEQILEELFKYRSQHDFRFAFRGQDIPTIYIGKNENAYEISCAEEELKFTYEVDINSLFEQLELIRQCPKINRNNV